jgi:hypothetical protein
MFSVTYPALPVSPKPPAGAPPAPFIPYHQRTINWDSRKDVYKKEETIRLTYVPTRSKIISISLAALASLMVAYAYKVAITASIAVSLLAVPALGVVAFFTAVFGLGTYIALNEETPKDRQDRERLIEQEIIRNRKLKFSEILEKFPKGQKPFSKVEFNEILFEREVNELSFAEFVEKHDIAGIDMLMDAQRDILKLKFVQYIQNLKTGLIAIMDEYGNEINAFEMTSDDVWGLIFYYEQMHFGGDEYKARNGKEAPTLTK